MTGAADGDSMYGMVAGRVVYPGWHGLVYPSWHIPSCQYPYLGSCRGLPAPFFI